MSKKFYSMLLGGTLTMTVVSLLLMSDSIIAGIVVGSDAVAGVTLVTPMYSLAAFFGSVISLGVPILYSTEMGKFNKERANQVFGLGLLMSIVVGVIMFVAISLFGEAYLKSDGVNGQIFSQASGYLSWMRFTILIMPVQMLIGEAVYSDGDETISTIASGVQGLGNIVFSVVLSQFMGIRGIGLASFIFYAVSLLIYLFPADKLPTAMFFIILMKVSCSSVTFSYHLAKKEKMEPIRTVPFGLCYSLMSFVFFYFINQFWLDALIWLPLLILSLEDVIEEKKIVKTTVILAVLFISNYYISYMTGVFTALYLIYLCFIRRKGIRGSVYSLLRLAGSAGIAFCCAGVLMLPTLYQMAGSLGDAYDGYGIVNYTPKQMILKLFIGYFDSIGNAAAPTIFCGTFVLILTVMYFLNKEIPIRERTAGAVFLLYLISPGVFCGTGV